MKIKLDLKIFLIVLVYILTKNIRIFALSFIFIFVHELGHVLAGLSLGLKITKINITILGFSIEFENYGKERRINRVIIDAAGPAVNLIIVIMAAILGVAELFYINLVLLLINLLPIFPLDGGRILKTLLLHKYSYKETMKKIEKISINTAIMLTFISSISVLYFKNISFFLITIYFWYLILKENKKNKIVQKAFKVIENNT